MSHQSSVADTLKDLRQSMSPTSSTNFTTTRKEADSAVFDKKRLGSTGIYIVLHFLIVFIPEAFFILFKFSRVF